MSFFKFQLIFPEFPEFNGIRIYNFLEFLKITFPGNKFPDICIKQRIYITAK